MNGSVHLSVLRWSNKWNWYSSGLNASILVWHTCASTLSGWVLYRQLELTKLTRPDLHHVVGLYILKDVRPSFCLSVRLSVCHTFLTMFLSLYYHEVFRSDYYWQKWCPCKTWRSEVKGQGHRGQTQFRCYQTITPVTYGHEMMYKAWCGIGDVPYCF